MILMLMPSGESPRVLYCCLISWTLEDLWVFLYGWNRVFKLFPSVLHTWFYNVYNSY